MQAVVRSFITTFQKALAGEMAAIQQRFGASAEMELTHPRALDLSHSTTNLYAFATTEPTDKLAIHMACTLRHASGELEVTITAVAGMRSPSPAHSRSISIAEHIPW